MGRPSLVRAAAFSLAAAAACTAVVGTAASDLCPLGSEGSV